MQTRAAVLREMGREHPYGQSHPLSIETLELDDPARDEVLVQVVSAGLCHSDLSVIDGLRPRAMPTVLGHEAAGIVREVGADVRDVAPGDHVVFSFVASCGRCLHCQTGRPIHCEPGLAANASGTLMGGGQRMKTKSGETINHFLGVSGFSEYSVAHEASMVKIDRDLPLEIAALFGCAVMTGVGAVIYTARAEPGSSAVVFGLGGVGLSAVMGARLAGCYPIIAVDMLPGKLELAREVGATHLVNAKDEEPVAAVKELTKGGAHYAFEAVGNAKVLADAYQATRRTGTTVAVGLPGPQHMLQIPAAALAAEERVVKGSFMGSCVPRRDIPRFLALYQNGDLPVDKLLTRTIALDEINEGFEALATGEAVRQLIRYAS